MNVGKRSAPSGAARGDAARRLKPKVERVERRVMLASGIGVIAGTAFDDANANSALDGTEGYLPGATVDLYVAGGTTPTATQVTDARGGYAFTGLAPGTYLVRETPPAGYLSSGTQALAQVEPATGQADNLIRVSVPSPTVFVNYNGVQDGTYQVTKNLVNNTPLVDSEGQFQDTLGSAPGLTDLNPGFLSLCLNDLQRVTFVGGEKFQVVTNPITSVNNGTATISAERAGRIAYLFNHKGNAPLDAVTGPALQFAIWELLYDTGDAPDFTSGNFQVVGPVTQFTSQATLDQVLAQAASDFNESAGKSEAAIMLDPGPFLASGQTDGIQSMIALGSYNFANRPDPSGSSLAGHVYCDANHDGSRDAGDAPVAGAVVTLTGTNQAGAPVRLATDTDAAGNYRFMNLAPGTYTVTMFRAPGPGYVPATDTQGTPGTGTVEVNRFRDVTLGPGVNGQDNDLGLVGRAVDATGVRLLGIHHQPTHVVLSFDGPLNAAASDPANYSLVALGRDETLGTADDHAVKLTSAAYDPSAQTVTLTPARHLNIHYHYVLRTNLPGVNACAPAVTSTTVFGRASVPYFNEHGRVVPNPPPTAARVRHDALVTRKALAALRKNPGLV